MRIDIYRGRYEVTAEGYADRDRLIEMQAIWNGQRSRWILPPHIRLRDLGLTPPTAEIAALERQKDEAERIRNLKDVGVQGVTPLLSDYQRVGAKFLATAQKVILNDYMGLGKTAQAIAACDLVGAQRILVVAKKTLCRNWLREITKFSLEGEANEVVTTKPIPDCRWCIIGFEALVRRLPEMKAIPWDVVICDEATYVKNRSAQRTKAVFTVARHRPYVWLLTGTLVRNRPDELWSLLHILDPDYFRSYWDFRKRHCLEEPVYARGVQITTKVVGVKDMALLHKEIGPYILGRSADLLGLPEKTHETIWVGMSPSQRKMYSQLKRLFISDLGDGKTMLFARNALEQLLRLKQIACDPRLVGSTTTGEKVKTLLDLLEEWEDYSVLVFSSFRGLVDLVAQELEGRGIPHSVYTGTSSVKERNKAEDDIQSGHTRILLATWQAAGEGLNLTRCDKVVFLDKPWTPSDVEQAEARAWRRGRTAPVHVVSLLTENSVEEYVEKILGGKLELYQALHDLRKILSD